jgi:hypothetical protein
VWKKRGGWEFYAWGDFRGRKEMKQWEQKGII